MIVIQNIGTDASAKSIMEDKTAELKVKLSKIKGKMRNLRDMRLEEDIDNDEFRERMQYLLKDEAEITAEITALTENKTSETWPEWRRCLRCYDGCRLEA